MTWTGTACSAGGGVLSPLLRTALLHPVLSNQMCKVLQAEVQMHQSVCNLRCQCMPLLLAGPLEQE